MRLDLADTLAILDRLLEQKPQTAKPAGFTLRLRRLRELLAETGTAEPTFGNVSGCVFPGVSPNSLRTTFLEFRKSLAVAAKAAGLQIEFIRPDTRGAGSSEAACYFEGVPLPLIFDSSAAEIALSREIEVIEPRARATKIFVSFAVADGKLSKEFTDQLKENLPLRFMEPVQLWRFDEKGGILPGEDNEEIIRSKMNESQFGILLVSPTYLSRPFIERVELPHFLGPTAKAHPIPVALADFSPGKDKHPLLDATNVFTHRGRDFYQTDKKHRGDFIKALCDHIADLIRKFPSPPVKSTIFADSDEFRCLRPSLRKEDGTYIPGRGRSEGSLAKSIVETAGESSEGSVGVLESLEKWVADPKGCAFMALLGEAGAGKTMTCSKLAQNLNARKPGACLYIDLRHLNQSGLLNSKQNPTLPEILGAILERGGSPSATTPERVLQAVREKGALLIWDGLDEVLVHLSTVRGNALFAQLKSALPGELFRKPSASPGRLLFACRTQFFSSFEHEASSLTGDQRGAENASESRESQRARFQVLRLLPFDDDQIRAYLEANVPGLDLERAIEVIGSVHNLRDLAQRPYCLSLMRASLPDLDRALTAGKKVRSVDLYRSLVRSWLIRDSGKHRFEEDDKPRLMACLAAWMWREGVKSLSIERLGSWLKETLLHDPTFRALYADDLKETEKRDRLLQDFRTATFIARWDGDSFRFAHTSLQEYFLATHLVRALEEGNADDWCLPTVNRETLDFAAELFIQRAEDSPAARTRLEKTLTRLMQENLPGRSENALAFYLRLHATGESDFSVPNADLSGLDLTAWKISGTTSRPLRLPAADFSRAKLIRVCFRDVEMTDSRWIGADLCSAEFVDCALERGDFSQTRLEGGRIRACRLSGGRITNGNTDGLRVELPQWDAETEAHWRTSATYLPPISLFAKTPHACWNFGHCRPAASVVISLDGSRIVSASHDNSVRVWDAASGQCLRVLLGHKNSVTNVAVSQNGKYIVSGSIDKTVILWDTYTGELVKSFTGHDECVNSVSIDKDSKLIASASEDRTIKIWDIATGSCVRSIDTGDVVWSVKIQKNASEITGEFKNGLVTIWNIDNGIITKIFNWENENVISVAISGDGQKIVTGSKDNFVKAWDASSGILLMELNYHRAPIPRVEISENGKFSISFSEDYNVVFADLHSGQCLCSVRDFRPQVIGIYIAFDGENIVTSLDDNSVCIWDTKTGDCLRLLTGHNNQITSVAISLDGTRIVSSSWDNSVRVWDAFTGADLIVTPDDGKLLNERGCHEVSDTLHHITPSGKELDIAALPDGGYIVLERTNVSAPWKIARAKGDYWRYVNYATDGPEGRVLWSADALGPVPEV